MRILGVVAFILGVGMAGWAFNEMSISNTQPPSPLAPVLFIGGCVIVVFALVVMFFRSSIFNLGHGRPKI